MTLPHFDLSMPRKATFVQRNAETGELSTVKYRLTFANGEMRADTFQEVRCVRDI